LLDRPFWPGRGGKMPERAGHQPVLHRHPVRQSDRLLVIVVPQPAFAALPYASYHGRHGWRSRTLPLQNRL